MKRFAKYVALALLVVGAAYAGRFFTSAEDAAMGCPEIQKCLKDGYTIDSCEAQPIYYFAPPTGEYEWGQFYTRLSAPDKPPIWATCHVNAKTKNGKQVYKETHNEVVTPIR